ncbi:MAG: GNAT family N-acetyltransferase [Candidatus Nomurabacteria bacterium]|jgi:RimJ/RimL family protein N-acetyltransferase|nr:GNAT family N-acetyltransferase [Candidatus Nomurabacteria bacterium]
MKGGGMKITTERLVLAPSKLSDAAEILAGYTKKVATYTRSKPSESVEEVEAWLAPAIQATRAGTNLQITIRDRATGEFIGLGGVHHLDTRTPEFGIWTKEAAWGNKYGREAVAGLEDWAQANLEFDYLKYSVVKENVPSHKIAEALGGVMVSEYKENNWRGEVDIVEYRIYPKKGEK